MRQLKIQKSITNRESQSIDKYLQDVSRLTMITAEEEVVLAQQIREGNDVALEKLVLANLRFVVSVAKQYQNKGLSLSDLINEGNLGLIKAAKRFDESRGFKFISYAVWWIRQSITQAISEQSRMIRLPLNKIALLGKIKKGQDTLEQKLERQATTQELSELIDVTEKELELTFLAAIPTLSFDSALAPDENATLVQVIADKDSCPPDHELLTASLTIELTRSLATLDTRENNILASFYGLGGIQPETLDEIAEKLNLTGERVRQIKEKALRKLKNKSKNGSLKNYL